MIENMSIMVAIAGEAMEDLQLPAEIEGYADVFSAEKAQELPEHISHNHTIELEGGDSPKEPIYKLSDKELGTLKVYIDECLRKGWIHQSTLPAGAPMIFIPKKDGTQWICINYQGLNNKTCKNSGSLPLV